MEKCIKMVGNKNFILSLYETSSGTYYLVEEKNGEKAYSEGFKDFKLANFLFEAKLQELEGN